MTYFDRKRMAETERLLGEAMTSLEMTKAKLQERTRSWLHSEEEMRRMAGELLQARESLRHQRRRCSELRRERWERSQETV